MQAVKPTNQQANPVANISIILGAALPSHSSGREPVLPCPESIFLVSDWIREGAVPTKILVPSETVIGRSVFSLNVKHGIPSAVVSSWIPPLSVKTTAASINRLRNSI